MAAAQFLSKSRRLGDVGRDTDASNAGPGSYNIPSSIKQAKPTFVGFSSTSTRGPKEAKESENKILEITPGPGEHDVSASLSKKYWSKNVNSSFRSGTIRFKDEEYSTPGPTAYLLPSSINSKKPKKYRKTKLDVDVTALNPSTIPSIPNKHQSYGYESDRSGKLVLQDPVIPGFSGTKTDTVGPGDYDPIKQSTVKRVDFGHGGRNFDTGIPKDKKTNPGPGYYNVPSSFEDFNKPANSSENYYIKMNDSMKRHPLSSFESRTKREFLPNEAQVASLPGPGQYILPKSDTQKIVENTKPSHLQCFSTSDVRFKSDVPRSLRMNTAPGLYDPMTSDFDKLKLRILKQKKMASRSGWVQNIAFAATERRFVDGAGIDTEGPNPTSYDVSLDNHKDPNTRNKSFGTTAPRFDESKGGVGGNTASMLGGSLGHHDHDVNIGFEGVPQVMGGGGGAGGAGATTSRAMGGARYKVTKPKPITGSFLHKETRFLPPRETPVPAPGTYDTSYDWGKAKGAVAMVPKKCRSIKKDMGYDEDVGPGPGDYNVSVNYVKKLKNRKNVLVSTSNRFDDGKLTNNNMSPGPTSYDPYPTYGSLLRQSHNVMLFN